MQAACCAIICGYVVNAPFHRIRAGLTVMLSNVQSGVPVKWLSCYGVIMEFPNMKTVPILISGFSFLSDSLKLRT